VGTLDIARGQVQGEVVQALRKEDIGEDNDVDRDHTESDRSWQLPAEREEGAVG
jgi:hypothetical protein